MPSANIAYHNTQVPQPEKEYRVGMLPLYAQVLAHEGGPGTHGIIIQNRGGVSETRGADRGGRQGKENPFSGKAAALKKRSGRSRTLSRKCPAGGFFLSPRASVRIDRNKAFHYDKYS